jgi:hypothetical protein
MKSQTLTNIFSYSIMVLVLLYCINCQRKGPENYHADVIIYGGTSAAVIAAVEVAKSGKRVIMVSPDVHLGGLSAGGLGWTDTGRKEVIGGYVHNEGDIGVSLPSPYEIAYGSLVPKREECENLLVAVCVSASHIAYGSIRMEPVFMILGQSAAVAASMAIDDNLAVQDVPYEKLRQVLIDKGQVLEYQPVTSALIPTIQTIQTM